MLYNDLMFVPGVLFLPASQEATRPLRYHENFFGDVARMLTGPMARHDAFYAILMCAAWADGEMAPEEREEIDALIVRTRTLGDLDIDELERTKAWVSEMVRKSKDRRKLMHDACGVLRADHSLAETIYTLACDIVMADRELKRSETAFLERLAAELAA